MSGAIPPLPQYDFMGWCSVEAQGTTMHSPEVYEETHERYPVSRFPAEYSASDSLTLALCLLDQ
jgi:hypothetical protein